MAYKAKNKKKTDPPSKMGELTNPASGASFLKAINASDEEAVGRASDIAKALQLAGGKEARQYVEGQERDASRRQEKEVKNQMELINQALSEDDSSEFFQSNPTRRGSGDYPMRDFEDLDKSEQEYILSLFPDPDRVTRGELVEFQAFQGFPLSIESEMRRLAEEEAEMKDPSKKSKRVKEGKERITKSLVRDASKDDKDRPFIPFRGIKYRLKPNSVDRFNKSKMRDSDDMMSGK